MGGAGGDGLALEGGEQRYVYGSETPGRQQGDHVFGRLRHQGGDAVALAHAEPLHRVGEATGAVRQFAVGDQVGAQVGTDDAQCGVVRGVPVAEEVHEVRVRAFERGDEVGYGRF